MADKRPQQQLQEQLENEVARLRDLAIKSIDPLIVAKAVAASDPNVQRRILARLTAGERLVEVFAFPGFADTESQIFFRFVPDNETIHVVDTGLLAFVDSTKGEVIGTVDPFQLQPEQRVGRPFVTVSPIDASKFAASLETTKETAQREQSFFESLGISGIARMRPGLGFGICTVIDTIFGTTTFSGGRDDDTRSDRTQDYRDQITISGGGVIA
jgi:hypothetical protein